MYGGLGRHYHSIGHIVEGLDLLEVLRHDMPKWFADRADDAAIELAWWGHDLVYKAGAKDNEKQAAKLMGTFILDLGFRSDIGTRAKNYIRDTEHRCMARQLGGKIVADIDLAPLAYPWERFCADTADIRLEYAHMSDTQWREGRLGFLQKMLDTERRPSIYQTDYFSGRYEAAARLNLMRAMEALK